MIDFFKIRDKSLDEEHERRDHLAAMNSVQENSRHSRNFDFLYGNLSILDSKSSALLTFNSIILAAVSIFQSDAIFPIFIIGYGLCMLTLLLSSIFCMYIIWIHWSSTDDLKNPDIHLMKLFDVRYNRTVSYRMAWWLGVISIITFMVIKLYEIFTQL